MDYLDGLNPEIIFIAIVVGGFVFARLVAIVRSQRRACHVPTRPSNPRMVRAGGGMMVEVPGDAPDGMADVVEACFKSGQVVTGEVKGDKVTITKRGRL